MILAIRHTIILQPTNNGCGPLQKKKKLDTLVLVETFFNNQFKKIINVGCVCSGFSFAKSTSEFANLNIKSNEEFKVT
jgi:hypothetical protein